MEKTIANRIMEILPNHSIRGINRVSTKPGSSVYRIRVFEKGSDPLDLYAKKYGDNCSPKIHEMMGLKEYHDLFLMPKIIDYHDGVLISEGINGGTLTRAILVSLYTNRKTLLECSWKIGCAIGALQNMTPRGTQRTGDLDLYLIREIESEAYFKTMLEKDLLKDIRAQAEELKSLKTRVSQHHGDPSPHNILMKNDQVFLIDYSFQDNATFMDPSLYMVSLELVKNRLGFPMGNTISLMKNKFMEAYSQTTTETYDQPIWSIVKKLNYLHFLLMYAKRKQTIKNTPITYVDRKYLLKKIKEDWNA